MSNWHVLDKSNGEYRIAYHIAIPAVNNTAGVPVRSAVINSGAGGATALADGDGTAGTITTAEKNSITAGAVVERIVSLQIPAALTGPQIIALVDANYAANSATLITELQSRLAQYGRVSAS